MKNLTEYLNESLVNESIIEKCKALTQATYRKIINKIKGLENPYIMVDVGLHILFMFSDARELQNVEHAVFGVKETIDKLNKYILDNVKTAKEVYAGPDEDIHLYELVDVTTEDAIKLYRTLSDMFIKEMKKEGVEIINSKEGVRGSGIRKFNHLETDAEISMERTLDAAVYGRPETIYIYPSVRLEYA